MTNFPLGTLLLCPQDCIFGCLADAELDDALGRNLDLLTGGWIATHTRFAIHQYQLPQTRNSEGVLGVLVSQGNKGFGGLNGLLFGQANGFRQ